MTKQQQTTKSPLRAILWSITGLALAVLAVGVVRIYIIGRDSQTTLTGYVALFMATIAVYSAVMVYVLFVVASREKTTAGKKAAAEEDRLLIEWLVQVAGVPVTLILSLVPAIIMGIFTTDNTPTGQAALLLCLFMLIALLFGPLIAAGIFAPIKLLVSGTIALIKGDRSKVGHLRLGGAITALTVFCLATGFAIHPYFSGVGGWSLVILGILGIPGAYDVKNEPLLWVARIVLAVIIIALIASVAFNKKTAAKKK